MVEKQVYVVVGRIDGDALLSGKECEISTHLIDELLHLRDDGVFQIPLAEYVGKTEHIKEIATAEHHIRHQCLLF